MQRSKLLGTRCGRRKFSSGLYGPDLLKLCGAKGIRTPALTRPNAVFTAVSFPLVPIRSRSLPAGSFSALDGVEIVHLPQRPAGAVSFNTPLVGGPLTIIFVRPLTSTYWTRPLKRSGRNLVNASRSAQK